MYVHLGVKNGNYLIVLVPELFLVAPLEFDLLPKVADPAVILVFPVPDVYVLILLKVQHQVFLLTAQNLAFQLVVLGVELLFEARFVGLRTVDSTEEPAVWDLVLFVVSRNLQKSLFVDEAPVSLEMEAQEALVLLESFGDLL